MKSVFDFKVTSFKCDLLRSCIDIMMDHVNI